MRICKLQQSMQIEETLNFNVTYIYMLDFYYNYELMSEAERPLISRFPMSSSEFDVGKQNRAM